MTATNETLAGPASLGNAATAIFALLGLIDVALTAVIGSADAPPLIVSLGVTGMAGRHERGRAHSMTVSPGEATP